MLQHDLGQAAVALCHLHVVLDVCARRRGPQRRAWAGRRAGGGADAVSGAALCFDASSASSVATAAARSRLLRLRLPPAQAGRAAHARPRAGHGASLPRQPHKIFAVDGGPWVAYAAPCPATQPAMVASRARRRRRADCMPWSGRCGGAAHGPSAPRSLAKAREPRARLLASGAGAACRASERGAWCSAAGGAGAAVPDTCLCMPASSNML